MQEKPPIFSAQQWTIIACCFAILAVASSLNFNFGIFIKPLVDDFGWSRTSVSAGFSIYMLIGAANAILAGGLADRFGTRRVVFTGMLLIAASLLLASGLQEIWEFYLLVGVLAGLGRSAFITPILAFIQRSFTHNRGLATGLAGSGGGLGILLSAPLIGYIISNYGWRSAYLLMGGIVIALTLPALYFIRPPSAARAEGGGKPTGPPKRREAAPLPEASLGMGEIVKRRPFWTVLGSHTCDCICHSIIIVHIVPFAIESGIPRLQAATLMSALGVGALIGRLAAGMLSDRIGPKWALFFSLVSQAAPIPLLLFSPTLPVLYLVASLVGLGLGGHGTMYPLVTREFYGPRRVGLLYGTFTTGASVGMAAGSFMGGVIYDLAGNYMPAFLFSFLLGIASILLVWTYPGRRYLPAPGAGPAGTAPADTAQPAS